MTATKAAKPALKESALYLGDNGRCFCGSLRCAGMTAYFSGRDLSGQRLMRLTADDAAWWKEHNQAGQLPTCETCKKEWTA